MASELMTSIQINARPEKVWEVFSKFESYKEWNPFIKSINGKIAKGEQLEVKMEGMTFKPEVLSYVPNKEFIWIGKLFSHFLFSGEHRFIFIDNQDGTTTLKHSELFKGILLPIFKAQMLAQTKANFEAMNETLKSLVENQK